MDLEKEIEHLIEVMKQDIRNIYNSFTDNNMDRGYKHYCQGKIDSSKNYIYCLELILQDYKKSKIIE